MALEPVAVLDHGGATQVVPRCLMSEILAAIERREGGRPRAVHASIQAALQASGWDRNAPIASGIGYTFDALKGGIAIEIEFWNQENAFKEWAKFQKAFAAGSVMAGVHVMRRHRDDPANCSAEWAVKTLRTFAEVFTVPVLVLGIDL